MDKRKAVKLSNYGKPKYCTNCGKMMKPALHMRIIYEGLTTKELAGLYKGRCEWCGYEFEYWA